MQTTIIYQQNIDHEFVCLFAEAVLKNPHAKGSVEKEVSTCMRNWRDRCGRRKKSCNQNLTDE